MTRWPITGGGGRGARLARRVDLRLHVAGQRLAAFGDAERLGDLADLGCRAAGVDRPVDHHQRVSEVAQLVERFGRSRQVGREQDGRFEGGDRFGRQRSLVADLRQGVCLGRERGGEIGRDDAVAEPEREHDLGQVAVERDDAIDRLDRDDVAVGVGKRDREGWARLVLDPPSAPSSPRGRSDDGSGVSAASDTHRIACADHHQERGRSLHPDHVRDT